MSSGGTRVRSMQEADLPAVVQIEKQSQILPWPAWFFLRGLRSGLSCWVLEREGMIQGYGIMRLQRGWAHLMNVCVAPGYRRQGLGRKILAHLLKVARAHSASHAWLEVRPSNLAALTLYQSTGFRKKQRRKGYYPARRGPRQDAIAMVCRL